MESILNYTNKQFITMIKSSKQYEAIKELATLFTSEVCKNKETLIDAMIEREQIMSTGIGFGLALPHVRSDQVNALRFAVGIAKQGIEYDSMDKKPVNIVIAVIAKKDQHFDYLKLVSKIVAPLNNDRVKESLINAESVDEIWEILETEFV